MNTPRLGEARYRNAALGGCLSADVDRRADGSVVLRSTEPLRWFPERLTDCLAQWAADAPDRTLVARRGADGEWVHISYAQMLGAGPGHRPGAAGPWLQPGPTAGHPQREQP